MDTSALMNLLSHSSGISLAVAAAVGLAGLLVGIAPSSLPLYSVVGGYVVAQASGRARGLLLASGFVLGLASVDAGIGVLFGFLGEGVVLAMARHLALTNLLLALLLAVLGLALLRKLYIRAPVLRPRVRRAGTFAAAYALGVPFGLTTCPECTPLVLPVLGAAAATGSPWLGGLLLFGFGLARGVPLLALGAAAQELERVPRAARWIPAIERAGGILLLAAAAYFFYQSAVYAGFVPPL